MRSRITWLLILIALIYFIGAIIDNSFIGEMISGGIIFILLYREVSKGE